VADVKTRSGMIGDGRGPSLLVAVVALCGYIVWQRYKQRSQGWS